MCFSATANFVGSAVLTGIGVATLTEVKHRRELLLAALPCLFALHQFTEGFVWLGLDHKLSPEVTHDAGAAFVLYAQGLLPFLLPLSVWLVEPTLRRRKHMLGFLMAGVALALYVLWGLIADPLQIFVRAHSIVYQNAVTSSVAVAVLYVIVTCGALFFSGFGDLILFGALNALALTVVMLIKAYAFTSVWCAYAAMASVVLYFFFRRTRPIRPAHYAVVT